MNNANQVKQITFSNILLKNAMNKAKKLGVSFPEYVRHLIIKDTELEVDILTQEEEKRVSVALKDFKNGLYDIAKSDEEIGNLFKQYDDEEQ